MASDLLLPRPGLSLAFIRPHCCFSCLRDVLKPLSLFRGPLSSAAHPGTSRTPQTSSISLGCSDAKGVQGFTQRGLSPRCRLQRSLAPMSRVVRPHKLPRQRSPPQESQAWPRARSPNHVSHGNSSPRPWKKLFCRTPHAYTAGICLHQDLDPKLSFSSFGGSLGTISVGAGCQRQGWEPRAAESQPRCLCPGTQNQLSCGSEAAQLPGSPSPLSPAERWQLLY